MRGTKGTCFHPEADSQGKRLYCCENGGGCRSNGDRGGNVTRSTKGEAYDTGKRPHNNQ